MLNYGILSWTAGTLSGGNARTGLGGNAAGVSKMSPNLFVQFTVLLYAEKQNTF